MKKLRLGVFGGIRGSEYYSAFLVNDFEIVAVCDKNPELLDLAKNRLGDGVACYTDFEEFFNHPMDAVFLANYFNEHAPYAIRFLDRGIHVLSECLPASTMAECVQLVRAAERSSAVYMFAENYPYMKFNREMKKICEGGTLGKLLYAEGEYNHPLSGQDTGFILQRRWYPHHWRNYCPGTYYVTHSLGPLMISTGARPRRVSAFPVTNPPREEDAPYSSVCVTETAAMITTLNDDGSVFRFTGCSSFGAHGNAYRICGEKGQMENLRGHGNTMMLRYNSWDIPEGAQEKKVYEPDWNHPKAELINREGHGGGDFFIAELFRDAILENKQPELDVYVATLMSAVAILGHRSMLEEGVPYDLPDFRKEEDRVKWEKDTLTPFWGPNGEEPTLPAGAIRDYKPSPKQMENYSALIATVTKPN